MSYAECYALGYRWWTVGAWWEPAYRGVKIGPLTLAGYEWNARRWNIGWTLLCSREHLIIGSFE